MYTIHKFNIDASNLFRTIGINLYEYREPPAYFKNISPYYMIPQGVSYGPIYNKNDLVDLNLFQYRIENILACAIYIELKEYISVHEIDGFDVLFNKFNANLDLLSSPDNFYSMLHTALVRNTDQDNFFRNYVFSKIDYFALVYGMYSKLWGRFGLARKEYSENKGIEILSYHDSRMYISMDDKEKFLKELNISPTEYTTIFENDHRLIIKSKFWQ